MSIGSSSRLVLWLGMSAALVLGIIGLVRPAAAAEGAGAAGDGLDWARARGFWSFRPPEARPAPRVRDAAWPRGPADRFILARLEAEGLAPSPAADRRTLIRRLSFDLTGLPPSPEEVDGFAADDRPDAVERLVDRHLASPRFGEKLASLWLPLARYAEDQAHQVGDDTKFFYPNAWRYRAWVIDAFNRDLPYDRFIVLQIAADRAAGARPEDLAALGFLGLGPKYYNRNRLEVLADEWEDRVDTVTRTFLGLTVACARCHDHKFDPITTQDYHALAGVFASTRMVNKTADGSIAGEVAKAGVKGGAKADAKADAIPSDALHIVDDGEPRDLTVFIRGNVERPGPLVERRFLRVLSEAEPARFREGSGRRELAAAIADRGNPLTARVLVNRVWGLLLGRPLVATPSNFGRTGEPPTHPELLDDLAVRFMERGWSVKGLVREIVLSAAYRQGSREDVRAAAADPENRLLWRKGRRRLAIEEWRDAALLVSGELEEGGGKSIELDDPANRRRTVHARVSRLKLNDLLAQFDYPDANVHAERRSATTTPLQKLFLMNGPFVLERARALAERLAALAPEGGAARARLAYRLLFGREPEPEELELALEFLRRPSPPEMPRWEQYAQALLASNEMLYVD